MCYCTRSGNEECIWCPWQASLDDKMAREVDKTGKHVFKTIEECLEEYFIFKYGVTPTKENFIELGFSWEQFHRVLWGQQERFYDGEKLILYYDMGNFSYYKAWEDQ